MKVYASLVQNKVDYLEKLFSIHQTSSENDFLREVHFYLVQEIIDVVNSTVTTICNDIMFNDEYEIKKKVL